MSKADKREQRIRQNQANVSLEDFEALINQYGYITEDGNHPKARIEHNVYPYKRENPVNKAYVKGILEIIDGLNK